MASARPDDDSGSERARAAGAAAAAAAKLATEERPHRSAGCRPSSMLVAAVVSILMRLWTCDRPLGGHHLQDADGGGVVRVGGLELSGSTQQRQTRVQRQINWLAKAVSMTCLARTVPTTCISYCG